MHALNYLLSKHSSCSLPFSLKDFNWSSSMSTLSWPFSTILFVVIFLPLTILEVDIDLKLPIPLPPSDVEENEVRPSWFREAKEVNPVSKEHHPLQNMESHWRQRKDSVPQLLLPRSPKKASNGSLKKSNENGPLPPKNFLKTSSGLWNVEPNWKGLLKWLPPAPSPFNPSLPYLS